jgi:hypothetical protein
MRTKLLEEENQIPIDVPYIEDYRKCPWFRVGKNEILYNADHEPKYNVWDGDTLFSETVYFERMTEEGNVLILPVSGNGIVLISKDKEYLDDQLATYHWKHGNHFYTRYKEKT